LDGLSKLTDTSFNFDSNGTKGSFAVNYTVTDAGGLTASGVITITVSALPIHPEANPLVSSMQEDTSLSIDLLTPNVDATSIVSASGTDGAVTIETNGTITFTPTTNFNGITVINYTVASDTSDKNSSTVTVTVNPVNDAPVIQVLTPTPILLTESDAIDQNISVDLNITDADGDALHINQIWSSGQVVVDGYDLTHVDLRVPAYVSGLSTITINVNDANNVHSEIQFDVNVTAIASVPYKQVSTLDIDLQQSEAVYSAGILVLPDNESYTINSIVTPSDTNIATSSLRNTMLGDELVITPADVGTTSLTLHIASKIDSNVGADLTWTVHVYDSANVPPVAAPSEITVEADGSVQAMLNVHDDNGDYLTYTYPTPPMNGTVLSVDGWNGQITYAAKNGFIGDDSFTYIAHDDQNASNEVTVTVHVTAAENNNDDGDQTSVTISLDTFNGYTALSADGVGMFQPEDKGDNGVVDMHLTEILTDDGSSVIHIYDNGVLAEDLPFTYEIDGDNTMSVDEDGDNVVDFVVKYLGTATKTEIETDLNLTLPAGSAGYKLASMNPQEDYDFWDEPVYADWNNTTNQGYNPYSSLDDYIADNTFDPNNPDWQHNVWIDGYEFMLESNGTIIRAVNYYDQANNQQDWYVTNPNAGSWEKVSVDIDGNVSDVVEIRPTAYGLTTVRLAMVNADGYVHEGEYQSAGQAELEYKFDENTAYHIGNSIMNVQVDLPSVSITDATGAFISFNSLPDEPLLKDSWMHAIWAYDDNGVYTINIHSLKFDDNATVDENATLEIRDTQDGDSNATYGLIGNIATIDGMNVDAKLVETITDPAVLSEELELPLSVFDTYHTGYRFAHIEPDASLDVWSDDVVGNDGITTYADYTAFETAFMNHEVALDNTPNGTKIVFARGISGVGGTLAEYDPNSQTVVRDYVGTWSTELFETEQIMVIKVYAERYNDNNAIALASNGHMSRADYRPADSGSIEYRFDDNTTNAIETYLNNNHIQFEKEIKILRDVEAVTFPNTKMNNVDFDVDQTTCERSVERIYDWLDGDSNSGDFIISNYPHDFTYSSSDGKIALIRDSSSGNDVFKVKVDEDLNATQLMSQTGLFLPMSAHGYRTTYLELASGEGRKGIKLDDATVEYLESYYNNNHMLDSMCGVPAP
jgi:hypothetical protein